MLQTLTSKEDSIASTSKENSQLLVVSNEINEIDYVVALQPTHKNKKVSKIQNPSIKKAKKSKIDESLDNAVEALKNACSKYSETENEFSVFGKHVGT